MVLFVVMKRPRGQEPMMLLVAKVVALGFQVAFGQNFGWLNERTENRLRSRLKSIHFLYIEVFFREWPIVWVFSLLSERITFILLYDFIFIRTPIDA